MTHLNVSEVFGPTIQGEGRHAGRTATFVRLAGCNLSCAWCDTPYTWDWTRFDHNTETHPTDVEAVAADVAGRAGRVVVSGGEPLLQAAGIAALMDLLPDRRFDVETNGTRPPGATQDRWDTVTVSPKVGPSAGQGTAGHRLDPSIIVDADFKFVVADDRDVDAAVKCAAEWGVPPRRVWLMPEGTDADTLNTRVGWVADAALAHGFNLSSRLHVLAWGDKRGR